MDDDIVDAIRGAIETAIRGEDHPASRGMLTNYILVAEHLGDDGETWTSIYSGTPHASRTLGLLAYADTLTRGRIQRDDAEDDG